MIVGTIAHKGQTLQAHLKGVAVQTKTFADERGLGQAGELIGLLHDLGKYSDAFQRYIQSATGLLNPDGDDEFVDAQGLKGKVDHSTAGAQLVWHELSKQGPLGHIAGQILALCIASHHSGLIDCLTSDPAHPSEDGFARRIGKAEDKAYFEEVLIKADACVLDRSREILSAPGLVESLKQAIRGIILNSPDRTDKSIVAQFQIGLLVRFFFSCLIDADRLDTADLENPATYTCRRPPHGGRGLKRHCEARPSIGYDFYFHAERRVKGVFLDSCSPGCTMMRMIWG